MKNIKHLFILIFTILLTSMSILCVSLYDNVKENNVIDENELLYVFEEDLTYFLMGKIQEIDETYQPILFDEQVPLEVQESLNELIQERITNMSYVLDHDENFIYSVTNLTTQESVSRNLNHLDTNDAYYMKAQLSFDERGYLEANNQIYYDQFNHAEMEDWLIDYFSYYIGQEDIQLSKIKNIEIMFAIPKNLQGLGYVENRINNFEQYMPFPALVCMIGAVIIGLFILIYPIRIVSEVNPFSILKKWKFGIHLVWLSIAIFFMVMGCMLITSFTINGYFGNVLLKYNIQSGHTIMLVVNFIMWWMTFYLYAIAFFILKYMFAFGFVRYLKEDTLIGSFIKGFKNIFNRVMQVDLSQPIHRQVLKLVVFHTAIILIITTFWAFGYILAFIYTFIMFFWINEKLSQIQKDHEVMLAMTQQLAQGNFDIDIQEDLGIFNPLKEEFKNIKVGFEKAVQEETKSQNMKTELISHVSHDLKTPLTCIKNYLVLLEDEDLTVQERKDYLENVKMYANRLNTLIEDLFEVSKVNSGNIQLELMELNIVALIEQTRAECIELLSASKLNVISHYAQPEILLRLDGGKTYRIFENLFTNIGKYAMKQSRVYIDVSENEEEVRIEFKNISAAQMNFTSEEIVERFVRGDASRHESGSGLGLAIVQSFTEVQGGTFKIEIDGDLFKTIIVFKKPKKEEVTEEIV